MNKKSIRIIEKFLRHRVDYRFNKANRAFHMSVSNFGKAGTMEVSLLVREDVVNCLGTFPFRGNAETAAKLSEFVCRVNVNLSVGHLDYDFNDGEVRFAYDISSAQFRSEKGDALDRFFSALYLLGEKFGQSIARLALGCGEPAELYKAAMPQLSPEKDQDGKRGGDERRNDTDAVPVGKVEKPQAILSSELGKKEERNESKDEADDAKPPVPVKNYSLEGLHVEGDFPIAKVESAAQKFLSVLKDGADALPDRPGFNILLWGPPGTGKSEFVNYLGQKLGRKVVVKMGSDILSRYVGDTEKSIREAFAEAEEENAILFLDELDGVMQNRAGASASWEVSEVNELLHQLEHFNGIMIGATNFKDNLDPAVLRRFTYKLQFDFLDDAGKTIFFDRAFKTPLTETEKNRLALIPNLTPGDFRTVSQSLFYLDDAADNNTRLAALEKESAMKGGGHKVCLGFSAR